MTEADVEKLQFQSLGEKERELLLKTLNFNPNNLQCHYCAERVNYKTCGIMPPINRGEFGRITCDSPLCIAEYLDDLEKVEKDAKMLDNLNINQTEREKCEKEEQAIEHLLRTDATIARVCEEVGIRPTDYPFLYTVTEQIERLKEKTAEKIFSEIENDIENYFTVNNKITIKNSELLDRLEELKKKFDFNGENIE